MKIDLKILIYLPILFFFLPSFSFFVPGLNGIYTFFYLSLYIAIIVMFLFQRQNMIRRLMVIIRRTHLIYFLFFILAACINLIYLVILGTTQFTQAVRSIIMYIILGIFPLIIYFINLLDNYISLSKFIKIFVILFWINLVLGIIAYIGLLFDITLINNIFEFFNNARMLDMQTIATSEQTTEVYFKSRRLCGLFAEPGWLGQFLFISLPCIYSVVNANIKLLRNRKLNFLIKHSLIPLTWLNLILTLSPIMLIYSCIITIIFYFDIVKKKLLKFHYIIFLLFIISIILTFEIDLSETYLMRIINIFTEVRSYTDFVNVEPSLATRISSYINEIYIFIQHPFTGVGLGNIKNHIYQQFLLSPVPLTQELVIRNARAVMQGGTAFFAGGFIYTLLAEEGIIITSLYCFFYFKLFQGINNICKTIKTNCDIFYLAKGLKYTLIGLFLLFIYNLALQNIYLNLFIVMSCMFIYKVKNKSITTLCKEEV